MRRSSIFKMPNENNSLLVSVRDLRSLARLQDLLTIVETLAGRHLVIDLSGAEPVYPNGAVPMAAAVDYLRSREGLSISFAGADKPRLASVGVPQELATFDPVRGQTLTDAVWKYSSESEAQELASRLVELLMDRVECEEGVLDTINWCLYEIMDNVFAHSRAASGFVMMQLHKAKRRCAIAVGDTGIGIQRSLVEAAVGDIEVRRSPHACIEFALQKGVTSKTGGHQGNGLYGLRRASEINGGSLRVTSGFGRWAFVDGFVTAETDRAQNLLDISDHQSTLIDWQLDCSRRVRIDEAIGAPAASSSEILEAIEDDQGVHRVAVLEIEQSLGSRKLGADVRTRLQNYLAAGAKFIVLDFTGVGVVSSSFADEVLGKLALDMGELEYRRRVFIDNASVTNRSLVETAIEQRLAAPREARSN